ncbi:putative teichuronic acid biosynthesis glycosyltransferase TuaG [Spirochaetia bacterium]|nr:putative teichuronic acid biosynthesis glycosyltransferase TuaG [Spirochaetia bacterium]
MNTPRNDIEISIITPNYNCSRFIAQTIESVLAQTYQNWEMLIIDDCSTDGSYEIALEYAKKDSRIKVYRMEHNSGAALCRNKAIELSQGQYLAFLDSDDLWLPEKLEKQLNFMQENDCDFSFTEYEHIDIYNNPLNKRTSVIKRLSYRKLLSHNFLGCLTVMYRQDLNNKIYGPIVKVNNDYALFLQVLKKIKNANGYSECLSQYRIRKNSISKNNKEKIISFMKIMIQIEHKSFFMALLYLISNRLIKIMWKYK